MTIKLSEQPNLMKEMADSLTQAIGACSQLIHSMQDPRWMIMRNMLEGLQERIMLTATYEATKVRPKITVN